MIKSDNSNNIDPEKFRPYLIQRLISLQSRDVGCRGIDRYFSLDYMGSAEFEFGAIGKTLDLWRDVMEFNEFQFETEYVSDPIRNTHTKATFYGLCVNSEAGFHISDYIIRAIDNKTFHAGVRLKEPLYISKESITGWFCVDAGYNSSRRNKTDYCFAFFRTPEDRQHFIDGLKDTGK